MNPSHQTAGMPGSFRDGESQQATLPPSPPNDGASTAPGRKATRPAPKRPAVLPSAAQPVDPADLGALLERIANLASIARESVAQAIGNDDADQAGLAEHLLGVIGWHADAGARACGHDMWAGPEATDWLCPKDLRDAMARVRRATPPPKAEPTGEVPQ